MRRLFIDLIKDKVVFFVFFKNVAWKLTWRVDKLRSKINFERGLQEQRNVIEKETEREKPKFMLNNWNVVEIVCSQVRFCLLQQLLSLLFVVYQFFLLSVHFWFQTTQPSIQVVFAKRMRNLVIVLQGILKIHLGWCILRLVVLYVPYSCFTASRSETAPDLCKFCSGCSEEGLSLSIISSIKEDAGFNSKQVGKDKIFISFLCDNQPIVEISFNRHVLHLLHNHQDCDIVYDEYVDCFFFLCCFLKLYCLYLFTLLNILQDLCVCKL